MNRPLAIIPCAGFGTRAHKKPHEAKEHGLISWTLGVCQMYGIDPLVITRSGKHEFNRWLVMEDVAHIKIDDDEARLNEWPSTVMFSQNYWRYQNLLLLPDTRWEPQDAVKTIYDKLEKNDLVVGLHRVPDIEKWGMFDSHSDGTFSMCEKPKIKGEGYAWGILGFKAVAGRHIFPRMLNRGKRFVLPKGVDTVRLERFKDVTR